MLPIQNPIQNVVGGGDFLKLKKSKFGEFFPPQKKGNTQ